MVLERGKANGMRLIDADELKTAFPASENSTPVLIASVRATINHMPTIEQPEIIRCRECKHYYFADNRIPWDKRYVCDIGGEVWQPDDYCSYGERREVSE